MFVTFTHPVTVRMHTWFNTPLIELKLHKWTWYPKQEDGAFGSYHSTVQRWQSIADGRLLNIELGIPFRVYPLFGPSQDLTSGDVILSELHWDKLDVVLERFKFEVGADGQLNGRGCIFFNEDLIPLDHPTSLCLLCGSEGL